MAWGCNSSPTAGCTRASSRRAGGTGGGGSGGALLPRRPSRTAAVPRVPGIVPRVPGIMCAGAQALRTRTAAADSVVLRRARRRTRWRGASCGAPWPPLSPHVLGNRPRLRHSGQALSRWRQTPRRAPWRQACLILAPRCSHCSAWELSCTRAAGWATRRWAAACLSTRLSTGSCAIALASPGGNAAG